MTGCGVLKRLSKFVFRLSFSFSIIKGVSIVLIVGLCLYVGGEDSTRRGPLFPKPGLVAEDGYQGIEPTSESRTCDGLVDLPDARLLPKEAFESFNPFWVASFIAGSKVSVSSSSSS
jgi:hypothetical protein